MAVVSCQVERQRLLESGETIWDDTQTSSAFVLDRSNPALNHSQTAVFPQSTESMPNPVAVAPPPERSRGEIVVDPRCSPARARMRAIFTSRGPGTRP